MSPLTPGDLLLGIDVGGTKVAYALGDAGGRLIATERRPTDPSGDARADLERIVADARALLERAGRVPADLARVGASVPGPIDPVRGAVVNPPNLPGWGSVPVRDALAEAFGCPAHIENDANAAALAEWRFGAGQGFRHLVYLTMSTGVGGGLVLGGRLHRGLNESAGEIGHLPVEWPGEPCSCGRRGCLEAYVGGASWTRRLRRETPPGSGVAERAGGVERVRPEHVVEAARAGDAFALAEFERWNDYLARGIVALTFVLAPEVVVLGTIATAAGEDLCLGPVRERVRAWSWPILADGLEIVGIRLGKELPYRAALCAAGAGEPGEGEAPESSG